MNSFQLFQALYPELNEEQQQACYQELLSLSDLIFTQVLYDVSPKKS